MLAGSVHVAPTCLGIIPSLCTWWLQDQGGPNHVLAVARAAAAANVDVFPAWLPEATEQTSGALVSSVFACRTLSLPHAAGNSLVGQSHGKVT